jgi:hypothetical protein
MQPFPETTLAVQPATTVRRSALPSATLRWLPDGKRAAVCFSIDDIHPGRSADDYDGGGDLDAGALGHVRRLLERHPRLWVTLFTTPDWRERQSS